MWKHIRKIINSTTCPLYSVGEYSILPFLNLMVSITSLLLHFILTCYSLYSDWNGSKRGHVYKFLRSQGFVSSYDIAHQYTDSDADAHKVSVFQVHLWCLYGANLLMFRCWLLMTCLLSTFFCLVQWVSHRNHRGNICGVDFIWLRNPSKSRKPLKTSWAEAVFGIIKVSSSISALNHFNFATCLSVSRDNFKLLAYVI